MAEFILSAFADEVSPDLDIQIAKLQQENIAYLEFRSATGVNVLDHSRQQIRQVASRLKTAGIRVSAVGSPIGKVSILEPFEPHLERFKLALEYAAILGTHSIRLFSFYLPHGEDPTNFRTRVIDHWAAFLEAARGSGITLLHENESGIYGDSPERCLDLLESIDSPMARATFDPANFVQCGYSTYPEAFELLKPYITYMHIKDAVAATRQVVPAGQGDGNLRKILKALSDANYQGFLSIEPHLQNSQPGGGEALFSVAAAALREILAEIA